MPANPARRLRLPRLLAPALLMALAACGPAAAQPDAPVAPEPQVSLRADDPALLAGDCAAADAAAAPRLAADLAALAELRLDRLARYRVQIDGQDVEAPAAITPTRMLLATSRARLRFDGCRLPLTMAQVEDLPAATCVELVLLDPGIETCPSLRRLAGQALVDAG